MMPSSTKKIIKNSVNEAYVWIWLPDEVEPVVAGKLTQEGDLIYFNYGQSYLDRENKISIYEPELPLIKGIVTPKGNLSMPGCIRDASPDAWGRRVIINKKFGTTGRAIDQQNISELTYLLESGSDRIGALDFQESASQYKPRLAEYATLDELIGSAEKVENGIPLNESLDQALFRGSAIGGARPKTLIDHTQKKYIAKFSSTSDLYSVIKAEFIAMRLAKLAGVDVANVSLVSASKKDVLLIERFDRIYTSKGWYRKSIVSALTIFQFDEILDARYASYELLAEYVRHIFYDASATLNELYRRLVLNILVGNTDDHARNHAAFWDGKMLKLTPAYDICPQPRTGGEASQAMLIQGNSRMSRLSVCIVAAAQFQLSRKNAIQIIEEIAQSLIDNWSVVCEEAQLSQVDKNIFKSNQFFNPYAFENLDSDCKHIEKLFKKFRSLK